MIIPEGKTTDTKNQTITGKVSVGVNAKIDTETPATAGDGSEFQEAPCSAYPNQNKKTTELNLCGDPELEECDLTRMKSKKLHQKYKLTYSSYRAMKYGRCGKRGDYELHKDWIDFCNFLRDMGSRQSKDYSIDRIESSNQTYGPGRCVWSSKKRQAENRSSTRLLTDDTGRCESAPEWGRITKTKTKTILGRIYRGASEHQAIHGKQSHSRSPTPGTQPPPENVISSSHSKTGGEYQTLPNLITPFQWRAFWPFYKKMAYRHQYNFVAPTPLDWTNLKKVVKTIDTIGFPAVPVLVVALSGWDEFRFEFFSEERGKHTYCQYPKLGELNNAASDLVHFLLKAYLLDDYNLWLEAEDFRHALAGLDWFALPEEGHFDTVQERCLERHDMKDKPVGWEDRNL